MKKILKFGIVLICMALPFSCNTDFLETKPVALVANTTTWTDGSLSQAFVFGVYAHLGLAGFEEQMLAAYTDEAMFTHAGRSINTFTEGTENASSLAWVSDTYGWNSMYKAIRNANIAIANLPTATFSDVVLRDKLLGESYFLRAYYYQQLLRFYGGVPIIEKPYGLNEDYSIARSSYDDCVKFIVKDLDKAAELLNGKSTTPGRTSKLAALALKSRVLLYAASDLHDGPTAKAKSSVLSGYADINLLAYPSGDRTARSAETDIRVLSSASRPSRRHISARAA